jgi:hypothetical protein
MAFNGHQVIVGKRMKNHNEQLMLIIPVVGHHNAQGYCDPTSVKSLCGLLCFGSYSTA